MARKRILLNSLAALASAGVLTSGCSDKNEYQSKEAGPKGSEWSRSGLESATNQLDSAYAPGTGNIPDASGSPGLSGTGYYDTSRAGVGGSALDTSAGYTTDTVNIKSKAPAQRKTKRHSHDSAIDSTYPPTGLGHPGGMGGSGSESDAGMGTPGGTGGGYGTPQGNPGGPSGAGAGGY